MQMYVIVVNVVVVAVSELRAVLNTCRRRWVDKYRRHKHCHPSFSTPLPSLSFPSFLTFFLYPYLLFSLYNNTDFPDLIVKIKTGRPKTLIMMYTL